MTRLADELSLSPTHCSGNLAYEDPLVRVWVDCDSTRLFYLSDHAAGAIGQAQGMSLLQALEALEQQPIQQLTLHINSSGANFREPLAGLFYLNKLTETLWQFRAKGLYLRLIVPGWLYGGMAMGLASVVHEVILAPSASMGLLGHRVSGQTNDVPIPSVTFQPKHLKLLRLPE
jgi:acetyl-CoA carboxylase beta subunit